MAETIYDTEGRILQTVDAGGLVTENVYNSLMQIEKVRCGAKGTKEGGLYNITGEIRETAYTYDDLGRTTSVTDALQGTSSVVFDSLGRITSMKDPNQNADSKNGATGYVYNKAGLLESETNAIGNRTTYQYNDKLLLKEMKDSANESTKYTYDSLNRINKTEDDLGTISYTYDENGNITDVTEQANAFAAKKTIHRDFDSLNRITKYTDYKGREVRYAYDALGNMTALTYPGGEIVRYKYQADGNPVRMESNSGGTSYYTDYTYDSYGRLKTITRPDGTVETREYNPAGQLVRQVDKKKDVILQENCYTYNVFGEVIEKHTTDEADPSALETVSMTYDSMNRLKTYNGQEVKYDAKGNMTYDPVDGVMQELEYDCRNRLISAGGVTYTYDAENTRIASTKNNLTTEYVTDTGGSLSRLLVAYEPDNTETKYYYGAEGLSSQYNTGTEEGFFYHFDNIGSTTFITDFAGKVVERFSYGTYGELLSNTKKKIRFLFNGAFGVTTDDNGLYYMRARYYNPDIKRFINQDIKIGDIGNSQSLNRYAYCEGNPVSLIDPFGLSPQGAQDQGEKSKFGWLHCALDAAGFFFDPADALNAALYALEGNWVDAALCAVAFIPVAGSFIKGGIKGLNSIRKAGKVANVVEGVKDVCKTVKNAGKAAEALSDTMRSIAKWGDNPFKLMDGITADAASKGWKALENGGDFARESQKAVWEMKAAVGADGYRMTTKTDEAASLLKKGATKADDAVDGLKGAKKADFYVTQSGDVVPSTGYRYISESATYLDDMSKSMTIPANIDGTYFSFNNYDIANPGALQVPHDASIKVSFDTLQIIDDISVPYGNWENASYLEPITKDFSQFGVGGATQVITHSSINIDLITKLPKK